MVTTNPDVNEAGNLVELAWEPRGEGGNLMTLHDSQKQCVDEDLLTARHECMDEDLMKWIAIPALKQSQCSTHDTMQHRDSSRRCNPSPLFSAAFSLHPQSIQQ